MGAPEYIIGFLLLLAGVLPTAGYGAISVPPADFLKARSCFSGAAICAGAAVVVWGFSAVQPWWARLLVVGIVGAIILIALTEGLRWLGARESGITVAAKGSEVGDGTASPLDKISDLSASKNSVSLRLQFRGGKQVPIEVSSENILSWYVVWNGGAQLSEKDEHHADVNFFQLPSAWTIFVLFNKPSEIRQLLVQPAASNFPHMEIKILTVNYVILTTFGEDPPPGILDIYSK